MIDPLSMLVIVTFVAASFALRPRRVRALSAAKPAA